MSKRFFGFVSACLKIEPGEASRVPEMKNSSCQTEPNEAAEENDNLTIKVNKCLLLLSHVNTKLDALAAQLFQQPGTSSNDPIKVKLVQSPLEPVKSLADMESLEDRCQDENFVKATVAWIGRIHGRNRFIKQGATVSLQIIDHFFAREFLLKCSWTGATRTSGDNEPKRQKIPFMKFNKTIGLFHHTVQYSDPEYSLDECKSFLHRYSKSSRQRFAEVSGMRKPVSRKRKRLTNEKFENILVDHLDDDVKDSIKDSVDGVPPEESTIECTSWQVEFLDVNDDDQNLPPELLKVAK
ncbi:uncharacterized protein LOC129719027 [Wyeomyia smithii]|uniref:uncharacterized protein LOC129719027 n=1 Tax=Wyeomyia smithii TaxID=174621 RepID=UPI00246821F1|nr:uncharacterized protein LOC129719027 [Wyeomyia smithii]